MDRIHNISRKSHILRRISVIFKCLEAMKTMSMPTKAFLCKTRTLTVLWSQKKSWFYPFFHVPDCVINILFVRSMNIIHNGLGVVTKVVLIRDIKAHPLFFLATEDMKVYCWLLFVCLNCKVFHFDIYNNRVCWVS